MKKLFAAILIVLVIFVSIFIYLLGAVPATALSTCKKISEDEQKNLCLAVVKGEPTQCEKLADWRADTCYQLIAFKTENASLCERVQDRHTCLAVVNADHAECEKTENKESCHFMIGAIEGDASACEYMSEEITNFCLAVLKRDAGFCADLEKKEKCYGVVAMLNGNASLCEKAEADRQEVCVALATRKGLNCTSHGAECTLLAVLTRNSSICNQIPTSRVRDSCYFSVALEIAEIMPVERVGGYF